jgi:hypothetical protein
MLPDPLGSGVYLAFNRSQYLEQEKCFWGVERGRRVSRLSRQCGILNISQPYRPPRPLTGVALLYDFITVKRAKFQDNVRAVGPPL